MTGARKFAFDTEFAPNGAILSEAPKRLGPAEVEAECAAAYERGKHDAIAQAERQTAAAAEALAKSAAALLSRLDDESRAIRADAARVAMAAARKIADAALDSFGADRAAAAIEAAMDTLRAQPRLIVRIHPDLADKLAPRITEMSDTHAYAGAVLVRPEPNLRAGDVVIDWSDGVVSISAEDTALRINALIEAALAADAQNRQTNREDAMSSDMKLDEMTPDFQETGLAPEPGIRGASDLAPVYDVPVNIQAVLGRSHMEVAALLRLGRGSVIELDRKVGEAIDIYVNNRLVARGEVVVVDDRLGVTMTEIIKDGDN